MGAKLKNPGDYILPPPHGWGLYYDPLYGYIPIHPLIRRALDLPSMQRLRHIKQLSTVELVFPGATHTRFEHSVGVFWLATRVFDRLLDVREGYPPKEEWPLLGHCHKLALQLAALFHNVGHGPGSHVFEIFCDRNPDFRQFRHEELTRKLITQGMGDYRDIPDFLNKLHTRLSKKMPHSDFLLPENVAAIATGRPPRCDPTYSFLSQIVSHEACDVDRMDYLCRDSMHTGVDVGRVDIWELIHNFTLRAKHEKGQTIWQACLDIRAGQALEALITARDLAYRKLYYNKTHRAAQEMMTLALSESLVKYSKDRLAMMTDWELLKAFEECSPFAQDVATRIQFRRIYETLPFEISLETDLDEIARRQLDQYVLVKTPKEYEAFLAFLRDVSKKLGLAEDSLLIYDLQPTPLTKKEAYTLPYLWDEAEGKVLSLLELFPHLRLSHAHREDEITGQMVDRHKQYVGYTHHILIALPFEYLNRCAELMQHELEVKVGSEPEKAQLEDAAGSLYSDKLEVIITSFIDWINLTDDTKKDSLSDRFRHAMVGYLVNLYFDRREYQ